MRLANPFGRRRHLNELYPRVGFIVTNLSRPAERVVGFYNRRRRREQWAKESSGAIRWTRLSCCANAVLLQLHVMGYNLANFMLTLALPEAVEVAVPRELFQEILRPIDGL